MCIRDRCKEYFRTKTYIKQQQIHKQNHLLVDVYKRQGQGYHESPVAIAASVFHEMPFTRRVLRTDFATRDLLQLPKFLSLIHI